MPQQEAADSPAEDRVEVDEDEEDLTYGDEVSSSSTSLRSSIMKYEWKNGRRYHSYPSGTYNFPNDDREQDRLDMVHHVYYRALNDRLFLAPIEPNGLRILDIGTGTGLWPIDLADLYPGATIFGNDLVRFSQRWYLQTSSLHPGTGGGVPPHRNAPVQCHSPLSLHTHLHSSSHLLPHVRSA